MGYFNFSLLEIAVAHNAERATLTADHATRQHMLSSEIQQLNKTRHNEVSVYFNDYVT